MNKRHLAVLALLLIALIAVVIGVERWLKPQIASERQAAAERALLDLLTPGSYDNHPLTAPIALPDGEKLGLPAPAFAYLATRSNSPSAVLLPVRGTGYEGSIDLLLAISPAGQLLSVKVLSEHETPGLGDISSAAKSPWLRGFFGHSVSDTDWRMKADGGQFDQMAGATVTSRAVSQAVQQGLSYFDAHKPLLLKQEAP
ncbi:MAG: RnfABCDGE type electron transport complex subunit G [Pseudomonas sp.]|uniref:RnfABCDGE type electron transport complex subunit G n=1 Tax=Pseudomonas sp. TaxID=306 RepID=UPI0030F216A8